jgi:hypothetical protein
VESPASSIRRTGTNPVTKHRRPRSDWVTHPGDLLADAFWLEQGLNKIKIEDREGNRMYPPDTQFKFSGWRNRMPVHMPLLQKPTPPPEDGFDDMPVEPHSAVPELPTFTSATQGRNVLVVARFETRLSTCLEVAVALEIGEGGCNKNSK